MQNWNREEIEFIKDRLDLSTKEIYLEFCGEYGLCRSYHSLQKKISRLREVFSDEPIEDDTDDLLLPIVMAKDNKREKQELKKQAIEWVKAIVEKYKNRTKEASLYKDFNDTTLCVVLSDLHFGKQTQSFNLDVAHHRVSRIAYSLKYPDDVDEVVLLLGGDLVEGEDIFSNQNGKLQCSVIEQVKTCVDAIWDLVIRLRTTLDVPVRIESVPGNHGRISKTANDKSNWDNVICYILSVIINMSGDPHVAINMNFNRFVTFRIKDKVGMLTHEGVKHTGTPATRVRVASWAEKKKFDFMVHGHYHEWSIGAWMNKRVIANGSLCGPDDFSEVIAKEDNARQAYFFVTPDEPLWGFSYVEWKDE
jgi:predicted phosphodiesterase